MTQRVKVLLLLTSLHGGGAEKVAVHLLNRMDPDQFDVRMGLLRASGPWLESADRSRIIVAPDSARFNFDGANRDNYRPGKLLGAITQAPRAFRQIIWDIQPDVVMSFLKGTNIAVWAGLMGLGRARPRWIAREGNNTLAVIDEEVSNRAGRAIVRRITTRAYRRADIVLANSSAMGESLTTDLGIPEPRVRVIENPLDLDEIRKLAAAPLPDAPARPFILTAGRFEVQKAHDVLLRSFAASAARASHDLVILGTGSLNEETRALAAELGLGGHVHFPGFTANPHAWAARADLFVLSSRWEGFPTAAAEAIAAGTPALLTDCRFGARDVLEHGESGWLTPVDDAGALTAAIDRLIGDPAERARLGAAGARRAERFGLAQILPRYEALFAQQAGRG